MDHASLEHKALWQEAQEIPHRLSTLRMHVTVDDEGQTPWRLGRVLVPQVLRGFIG